VLLQEIRKKLLQQQKLRSRNLLGGPMHYKNLFSIKLDYKSASLLVFLAILPNVLGMLNISTSLGFKLHFFQIGIFAAAMLYGPVGGAVSGGIGSVYSAILMNNPYIIVGNIILGLFAGLFISFGMHTVLSVILAYLIQLPWLWLSDIYLAHMPLGAVKGVVAALLFSNIIWAALVHYTVRPFKKLI